MKERILPFSRARLLSQSGIKSMSAGITSMLTMAPMTNIGGSSNVEVDVTIDF